MCWAHWRMWVSEWDGRDYYPTCRFAFWVEHGLTGLQITVLKIKIFFFNRSVLDRAFLQVARMQKSKTWIWKVAYMITISLKNISHRSINSLCYIFIYYTFWIFNHRKPHLEPSNGQTHQIKQTQPINTVENVFYVFTFPQCTHFYYFVTKVSKVPFPFEIIKCKLNYSFAEKRVPKQACKMKFF